jgi:glyoxylase-like metal-dependent hydrolase (beta-lactamase superfamily II)
LATPFPNDEDTTMMTPNSRSNLVKWAVSGLFACVAVSLVHPFDVATQVVVTQPQLDKNQAGFYHLKVGRVEVTALSDGTLTWDALGQLTNISPDDARRLLDESFLKSPIVGSVNAYLIRLGGRLILVDAGTGETLGPILFKLPDSLKAIGYTPDQITDILVTHIHPDHTGGLAAGGKKVFPNATVHVNKRELAYWTDHAAMAAAEEPTRSFFASVEPTLGPYVASGSVTTFDGETQLFPGLRAVPSYGHTPGQVAYHLEDGAERMIFCGDIVHVPAIQFSNPEATIKFDVDSKAAARQRINEFEDAAKSRTLVAMPHMYFPGVGHVAKEGDHYRWIPIPYLNDAKRAQ